jgi:two-component system, NtrC family, response regulator AtoC
LLIEQPSAPGLENDNNARRRPWNPATVLRVRKQSLFILPAASSANAAALREACAALGYGIDAPAATQACSPAASAPVLVVLDAEPEPGLTEQLRTLRRRGTPLLAVLCGDAGCWHGNLAALCCDCLRWPCEPSELGFRLGRLCAPEPAPTPGEELDPGLASLLGGLNLIGRAPAFLRTMGALGRMLPCAAPVLIEGETGTGKELVARALHYLGPRAGGPFVPVNCGALPDHLIENELFGHERGAYTDARSASTGAIGAAAGGTLFLDEIEALSPKAQAALLRFLQGREYRPLGGTRTRTSDARVVAASNADLRTLAAGARFRGDLFFRLDVLSLRLPPLRERRDDIAPLARHFVTRFCAEYGRGPKQLAPGCIAALEGHDWPGNIRELENLIHRSVLLTDGPLVFPRPHAAGTEPAPQATSQEPFAAAKARAIEAFERSYLTALLLATGGNVSEAARRADKERRALGKLLKKHALLSGPGGDAL